MRLPKVRITIGRIMIAIALVAVALVALPEPVFVIRLPNTSTAPAPLPDGSLAWPLKTAEIHVTRPGALLIVAVAGAIVFAAVWLARRLLRIAHRPGAPDPAQPQ
jgi:hypothetical protein